MEGGVLLDAVLGEGAVVCKSVAPAHTSTCWSHSTPSMVSTTRFTLSTMSPSQTVILKDLPISVHTNTSMGASASVNEP